MVYKQSIHKKPAQSHKLDLQIIQLRNNSSAVTLTPSNLQGLLRQCAVSQCIASMLKALFVTLKSSEKHNTDSKSSTKLLTEVTTKTAMMIDLLKIIN